MTTLIAKGPAANATRDALAAGGPRCGSCQFWEYHVNGWGYCTRISSSERTGAWFYHDRGPLTTDWDWHCAFWQLRDEFVPKVTGATFDPLLPF